MSIEPEAQVLVLTESQTVGDAKSRLAQQGFDVSETFVVVVEYRVVSFQQLVEQAENLAADDDERLGNLDLPYAGLVLPTDTDQSIEEWFLGNSPSSVVLHDESGAFAELYIDSVHGDSSPGISMLSSDATTCPNCTKSRSTAFAPPGLWTCNNCDRRFRLI